MKLGGRLSRVLRTERGKTRLSDLSWPIPACHGSPSQAVAGLRAGSLHQQLLCRAFFHADDVRTLDSSRASLEPEATMVEKFVEQNFLSLNAGKCEVVDFSRNHRANYPSCTLGEVLTTKCVGK